jgi:drug/metabolite transporter (DMT)-like permease
MPLLALWFYSKALIIEEVTRIATLFQIILVFVVLLSVVFLGEILGMRQYVGIGLTVLASMLISYKKSSEKSFFSALKFMIPFGIIMAAFTISNKFLLRYLDFWSMFFWNALGTCCGVIFLLSRSGLRKEFAESITIDGKKAIFLTFVGEGLFVIGTISSLAALSLADASLVSALFNTQLFYVFLYTLFLSLLLPKILKEEINKSTTSLKIFAIALMFIGTWLVI